MNIIKLILYSLLVPILCVILSLTEIIIVLACFPIQSTFLTLALILVINAIIIVVLYILDYLYYESSMYSLINKPFCQLVFALFTIFFIIYSAGVNLDNTANKSKVIQENKPIEFKIIQSKNKNEIKLQPKNPISFYSLDKLTTNITVFSLMNSISLGVLLIIHTFISNTVYKRK